MEYATHTRHNQPSTVAVVIDPEGGEHPCHDIADEHHGDGPGFWCAGMVDRSVGAIADRLWAQWFAPSAPVREWDELRALEAMVS